TAAATLAAGAIVVFGSPTGTIAAHKNSFATGVTPSTVVFFTSPTVVDVSNPLPDNAAFVADLYDAVLHRAGDTASPSNAGGLITAMNDATLLQGDIVRGVMRSAEGLGAVVDHLYLTLLGRASDPAGRAGFVSFLQSGRTVEQAITSILTSSE